MVRSGSGCVSGASGCPTVGAGVVSPARVQKTAIAESAPDNHFITGPDGSVPLPAFRRVTGTGGCPGVRRRVVSAAVVQRGTTVICAPDDHLSASLYFS